MGLDMYLNLEVTLPKNSLSGATTGATVLRALGLKQTAGSDNGLNIRVVIPMMYWRKAYPIHEWFATHTAGEVSNNHPCWIDPEKLLELRTICRTILKQQGRRKAARLLPVGSYGVGFQTPISADDLRLIRETDRALGRCFAIRARLQKIAEYTDFYYQASW